MRRRSRGFTLIEIMVVTGVIAIGAAVAVPQYFRVMEGADRRAVVRNATHHLQFVRMAALAHGSNQNTGTFRGIPGIAVPVIVNPSGPSAAALLVTLLSDPSSALRAPNSYTGLRVISPTSYALVARRNGTLQTLGIVVVNEDVPTMRIVHPLPLRDIRFNSRGLREARSANSLIFEDAATGNRTTIEVSLTGKATVN